MQFVEIDEMILQNPILPSLSNVCSDKFIQFLYIIGIHIFISFGFGAR